MRSDLRLRAVSAWLFLSILIPGALLAAWRPGLQGGYVVGAMNRTAYPAITNVYLGPHAATNFYPANSPDTMIWANNRTWVYWGQIYLDGGPYVFSEYIMDTTELKIDGETVLEGRNWTAFESSDPIALSAGWHEIVLRLGHGTGRGGLQSGDLSKDLNGLYTAFGISREETRQKSMERSRYPVDSGRMDLFRHDDGLGAPTTFPVQIAVEPSDLLPEGMAPLPGWVDGLETGTSLPCSAPAVVLREGVHYRCLGYVVSRIDEDGAVIEGTTVTNLGTTAVTLLHEANEKLVWLYENDGFELVYGPVESTRGDLAVSRPPDLDRGCYAKGTTVTLTATETDGGPFASWVGDYGSGADRTAPTITLTIDRPRTVHALFHPGWTFDPATGQLTDGNWVFKAQEGDGGALSLDQTVSVRSPSVLELGAPIRGTDGRGHDLVSIGNISASGLVSVFLPDTLRTIRSYAFRNCPQLEEIVPFLPDSVERIESSGFNGCRALQGDLRLANRSLKSLPISAFENCVKLGSVALPHVEVLEKDAFWGCSGLTNVVLSETLRTIGPQVFENCGSLEKVTPFLPATLESLGYEAFVNCQKLRGDVRLTNQELTTVGQGTFSGCKKLECATMPAPRVISNSAFDNCSSLTNVLLSERLETVGQDAFSSCVKLRTIAPFFAATLTSCGQRAFFKCHALESPLTFSNPAMRELGISTFEECFKLPRADLSSVATLAKDTFWHCDSLGEVVFSDALEKVGVQSFKYCGSLTNVTPLLPGSVRAVERNAFSDCPKLRGGLVLSNPAFENLGASAFEGCRALEGADLSGVRNVPLSAFESDGMIRRLVLSPSLTNIATKAFHGCGSIESVSPFLPDFLVSIGQGAFQGCARIEGPLHLSNDKLVRFGRETFRGVTPLKEVHFSRSQVHLEDTYCLFYQITPGASFYFPGKAPALPIHAETFPYGNGKRCTLYGSLRIDPEGWAAIAEPLTDADRAAPDFPGEKTFGVFTDTYSKVRHWCVDWRSPCEPHGTVLVLR